MNSVERVKLLCKERKVPVSRLEKDLGYSNGYIGQLRKGVFPSDRIQEIADYFSVSSEYLMTGKDILKTHICPECGLSYDPSYPEDVEEHNKEHSAWKKAIEKFGVLYCNGIENERIKTKGRNACHDLSLPLEERYAAQLQVLRCLFSRSVMANGYDLKHVSFEKYVAMMLGNKMYQKNLDDDLYESLVATFGTSPGIDSGSVYDIASTHSHTIAAHFDSDEFTEDELDKIKEFAAFVKSTRKK